jgi:tetratricopeptide (TPR) repeat protein
MYNKPIKYTLSVLLFAFAIYQFFQGNIGWGILLILLTGIVVLTIFKNEVVMTAFYYIRKGNMQKAQSTLQSIKYPEKLGKSQEAYYYFLQGIVEAQLNGPMKSEKFFKRAMSTGLRMKTDQAVAALNLAGIYLAQRKKTIAIQMLKEAKKLDDKRLMSDQIKEMETHLKRI